MIICSPARVDILDVIEANSNNSYNFIAPEIIN